MDSRPDSPTDGQADSAVEQTLRQQATSLHALAHSLITNEHDADDIVQTAWVATLERPNALVRDARAWTSGLVRNLASKLRRGEERRRQRELEAARRQQTNDHEHGAAETLQRVTNAVLSLTEPYRSTVLARYFEGLSPSVIAARDDVPVATIKSRLQRGLRQLRTRLDADHGGDRDAWRGALATLCGLDYAAVAHSGAATASAAVQGSGIAIGTGALMKTKYWIPAAVLLLIGVGLAFLPPTPQSGPPGLDSNPTAVVGDVASATGAAPSEQPEPQAASPSERQQRASVATTGALRGRVFWSNGVEPAAHVGVHVMQWGSAHPRIDRRDIMTDAEGRFELDGLAPGKLGIYGDRSGFASVEVAAGETAEATLRFKRGLTIEGRVVNSQGDPVSGAEVWISDSGNSTRGAIAMLADDAGRFELREMTNQSTVGARHPDYGPSWAQWIRGALEATVQTTLVLADRGSALDVIVVDYEQRPVRDAAVRIRCAAAPDTKRPEKLTPCQPSDYILVSDFEGRVAAPCLTPGEVAVTVAAASGAPATRTIQLDPNAKQTIRIALSRGLSISGRVSHSDGTPFANALIRVGGYGHLESRQTRSEPDGSFELCGISAGEFNIIAGSREHGYARAELSGEDGEAVEWSPVLDPGRVVAGTLVDERGDPLSGWMINVRTDDDDPRRFMGQTRSAADGTFRVVQCPDGELEVQAIETPANCKFVDGLWRGISADGEPREFRILDAWRTSSYISGRTVDSDGTPIAAQVAIYRPDRERPFTTWSDKVTGQFRIGKLAPGEYTVAVRFDEKPTATSPTFTLGAHADHALGDVGPAKSGHARIDITLPDGVDAQHSWVSIVPWVDRHSKQPMRIRVSELQSLELPAGRYNASIWGDQVLDDAFQFEVQAGAETKVALRPQIAAQLPLMVRLEDGQPISPPIRVTLRTLDGAVLRELEKWPSKRGFIRLLVPPDTALDVEISHRDGMSAMFRTSGLSASSNPMNAPPRAIVLRR